MNDLLGELGGDGDNGGVVPLVVAVLEAGAALEPTSPSAAFPGLSHMFPDEPAQEPWTDAPSRLA